MNDIENNYSIKEIHDEMLILLKEFHNICNKFGIKYSLHGGTLLGAVREKGFIPWDDDIDVSLTREEYDKLCYTINNIKLPDEMSFDKYSNKVTELWLKRKGRPVVWLDIYVYDFITKKTIGQKIKTIILIAFTAFTKTKKTISFSHQRKSNRKLWQTSFFEFFYIIGKPFNQKLKINLMQNFSKNCFLGDKSLIQRSNDQYIALNCILPTSSMKEYMMVDFENTKLMVTINYHDVLLSSYGADYMTPQKGDNADNKVHLLVRESINK